MRTADPGSADQLRSKALRANERADYLPERAREHMERTIREDDEPDAGLARYVLETSDRDYFRAFSKLFNDPVSGAHLWSPEEREAVQRVKDHAAVLDAQHERHRRRISGALWARSAGHHQQRRRRVAAARDRPRRHHVTEREAVRHEHGRDRALGPGID